MLLLRFHLKAENLQNCCFSIEWPAIFMVNSSVFTQKFKVRTLLLTHPRVLWSSVCFGNEGRLSLIYVRTYTLHKITLYTGWMSKQYTICNVIRSVCRYLSYTVDIWWGNFFVIFNILHMYIYHQYSMLACEYKIIIYK